MKKYINLLLQSDLFKGLDASHILDIIQSEFCYIKDFDKKIIVHDTHKKITHAGIVLDGAIDVLHLLPSGHESLVRRITPGQSFGTSFSLVDSINTTNSFRTASKSTVLFINLHELVYKKETGDMKLLTISNNLVTAFAKSNISLNAKLQILTQKTLREKLLTYFDFLSVQANSKKIVIPFNREQLSSYLDSERSSVCRELSRLAQEGLITIDKNQVTLL